MLEDQNSQEEDKVFTFSIYVEFGAVLLEGRIRSFQFTFSSF